MSSFAPFSGEGFLDDLRTARAVIAGGGFSLMSEAVSLEEPMLSIPIEDQFEQDLNARYLEQLRYGAWTRKLGVSKNKKPPARLDSKCMGSYDKH